MIETNELMDDGLIDSFYNIFLFTVTFYHLRFLSITYVFVRTKNLRKVNNIILNSMSLFRFMIADSD